MLEFDGELTDGRLWRRIDSDPARCPTTRAGATEVAYRAYELCPSPPTARSRS